MTERILIVDDHPLFRGALRLAISGEASAPHISEAEDFGAALSAIAADSELDLVLLDLNLPGATGFSGLMQLRSLRPALPVIIVSGNADPANVSLALQLGASGFIPKTSSVDTMRLAMRTVLDGGVWTPPIDGAALGGDGGATELASKMARLTPQQMRVLTMLSEGLLNKQIAYELDVAEATVKAHVSAILQKLEVGSRTQAVIAAHRIIGRGSGAPRA